VISSHVLFGELVETPTPVETSVTGVVEPAPVEEPAAKEPVVVEPSPETPELVEVR
jgi:hypothetical protein